MGKQSRRQARREQSNRDVVGNFLSNAQPLVQAASADGPLTMNQLQTVLDEAVERDHLQAFSAVGPQRDACLALLVEAASQAGNDLDAFSSAFARIDPDSPRGTTPVAMMAVAAENLDRWLGPPSLAAPAEIRAGLNDGNIQIAEGLAQEETSALHNVKKLAAQGECATHLPRLLLNHGGELVMITLIGVVGEISARWSASADEYHDTHLHNTLR